MSGHTSSHIRGIMLPSGEVLFSEGGNSACPWCELIDMQGCFMHLTCGQSARAKAKLKRKPLPEKTPGSG